MASRLLRRQVMTLDRRGGRARTRADRSGGQAGRGLRVGVKNGGCAGMSYTMELAETANPTDEIVEDKGVKVLIDPKAVLFLLGSQMDFKVDRLSATFAFSKSQRDLGLRLRRERRDHAREPRGASRAGLNQAAMDAEGLNALFEPFGSITVKRMFGGSGIYAEGLCFAIELKGEVFLKTDALSQASFSSAGCEPFVYVAKGQSRPTSYWSLPAAAHKDGDELRRGAAAGLEAARRVADAKAKPQAKRTKGAKSK